MNTGRILRIALVSALATAALGGLARAPYDPPHSDQALLRLSWRMRSAGTELCRARTPAELEALPVHMRSPEVCENQVLAYRLVVQVDEAAPDTLRVLPGGVKQDRPAFVLHELLLAPGPHHVRVRFEEENGAMTASYGELAIDTVLNALAGGVELITLEPNAARLIHRSAGRR